MRNIISVGTDVNVCNRDSNVFKRHINYAKNYNKYIVIVVTSKKLKGITSDGVSVIPAFSYFKPLAFLRASFIARKVIKNTSSDEQWTLSTQDPFETGLCGLIAILGMVNVLFHVQLHTDPFSPYFSKGKILNKVRVTIMKKIIPRARLIRVVSKRLRDGVMALGVKESNIEIRPIEIDKQTILSHNVSFDLHATYPHFKKIIVMVSRLVAEKDYPFALDVFKEFLISNPDTGLIIVGDGPERKRIEDIVLDNNMGGKVIMLGWKNGVDTYSAMKTADIFLQTSMYEGYGMSLVEANTCGVACVSSDVGVAREILSPEYVFPVRDIKACLRCLNEVMKNENK